jgi:hypothetical protein
VPPARHELIAADDVDRRRHRPEQLGRILRDLREQGLGIELLGHAPLDGAERLDPPEPPLEAAAFPAHLRPREQPGGREHGGSERKRDGEVYDTQLVRLAAAPTAVTPFSCVLP